MLARKKLGLLLPSSNHRRSTALIDTTTISRPDFQDVFPQWGGDCGLRVFPSVALVLTFASAAWAQDIRIRQRMEGFDAYRETSFKDWNAWLEKAQLANGKYANE